MRLLCRASTADTKSHAASRRLAQGLRSAKRGEVGRGPLAVGELTERSLVAVFRESVI